MSDSNGKTYKIVKKHNYTKSSEAILGAKSANIGAAPHQNALKAQYSPVETIPSTDIILDNSKKIFHLQVQRLSMKAAQGYGLDDKEMKQLEQCVVNILRMKKDEREEMAHGDLQAKLAKMTETELLEYAKMAINASESSK